MGRLRAAVSSARRLLAPEPVLTGVGVAGIMISVLCLVAVAARGSFIPPEGKMLDAATFTFGVGLFTLTMALLLPLAGYAERARRRWRRGYLVFACYGLVIEPIQAFRGLDPRFTEAGGLVDVVAGIVFGLTALSNVVVFVALGLRFFRADVLADRPGLRLGIRYGASAVTLSFGVGIAMSVAGGRTVGEAGSLMLSHGLGVHGIQGISLAALLWARAGAGARAQTWTHAAGLGWLAACAAALVQALMGRPALEGSVLTGLIVAGLCTWGVAAGWALCARPPAAPSLSPAPR